MSQSGTIAAALMAAFVIWLAANDRLQVYAAVLWGDTAAPKPSGNITPTPGVGALPPSGMGSGPSGTSSLIPDLSNPASVLDSASSVAGLLEFLP